MTAGSAFDHRVAGTAEDRWERAEQLRACARLDLPAPGTRVLVLAAHPDDESVGAGGLIAMAARTSAVDIVVASDGAASHPDSTTHTPSQLRGLRRDEVVAAARALSPSVTVTMLDLPDGHLSEHRDEIVDALEALIGDDVGPVWLISPWSGDRHPDHEACATAARTVGERRPNVTRWEYPIWLWHWADVDAAPYDRMRRLDLDARARGAKDAALACHVSQHEPLSPHAGDEAILPASMLAHFRRPFETFIEASKPTTSADYFDALYDQDDDPWGLGERFYERRKRALLMDSLPRPRFGRAFEPGCATGELTSVLAQRCDQIVAADVAGRAVEMTRRRLGDRAGVSVCVMQIPRDWPDGRFDLIVLSEVAYYVADLTQLQARVDESLSPAGVVVCCHWRHPAIDHVHTAEAVHAALGATLFHLAAHREADFVLDVFSRDPSSVAQATGIVAKT